MRIPSQCPVCGAYSLEPEVNVSSLLAVCDVLVIKALEQMGKWIVKVDRSRFRILEPRPMYLAHTLWQADERTVSKALRNAWDVVPAMMDRHGCCDVTSRDVIRMLNGYVHDLVITGTPHSIEELGYRFRTRLDLPVVLGDGDDEQEESGPPALNSDGSPVRVSQVVGWAR